MNRLKTSRTTESTVNGRNRFGVVLVRGVSNTGKK